MARALRSEVEVERWRFREIYLVQGGAKNVDDGGLGQTEGVCRFGVQTDELNMKCFPFSVLAYYFIGPKVRIPHLQAIKTKHWFNPEVHSLCLSK
jgi:hypothetical protein